MTSSLEMRKHLKSKAKNKDGQVIINLFSLSEIFAYDDEFGFEMY